MPCAGRGAAGLGGAGNQGRKVRVLPASASDSRKLFWREVHGDAPLSAPSIISDGCGQRLLQINWRVASALEAKLNLTLPELHADGI